MEFQEHYNNFLQSWAKFKASSGGTAGQENIEHEGEVEAITAFLVKYKGVPEAYIQAIDRLLPRLNPSNIKPENITSIQADLTELESSAIMAKINTFSKDILVIVKNIYEEYEEAGVAHEINNPIGFLNGSINNIKDYAEDLLKHLALYQQYYPDAATPVQKKRC